MEITDSRDIFMPKSAVKKNSCKAKTLSISKASLCDMLERGRSPYGAKPKCFC